MFRKTAHSLAVLILAAAWIISGRAEAQLRPSSAVLLPYFEVDLGGTGKTTVFAVGNILGQPVDVLIEVRTNWGIVVASVPLKLEAHEVKSFNLRDWIVEGKLPTGPLSQAEKARLKMTLSGKAAPQDNLFYSTPVASGLAVGSVVIRVQGVLPGAALWGDFLLLDPEHDISEGDDLVNLDSSTSCPGSWLCLRHALRYLSSAALEADTQVIFWTDRAVQPSKSPYPENRKVAVDGTAYNEAGDPIGGVHLRLLPLQVVSVESLKLLEPFGWLDLLSEEPTFIGLHFDSLNRDGAALQAYCLKEPPSKPHNGPKIELEKRTNDQDADSAPGPKLAVGSPVRWDYVVTNSGNVPLSDVAVDDDQGVEVHCPKTALDPGESMTCFGTGTAVACQYVNIGTATGKPPSGPDVKAADASHYFGGENGKIDIETATNGEDADAPTGPEIPVGRPVAWTYVVTNTGEVNLTDVKVTDSQGVAVSCPKTSLHPGESMTCTADGTAISGDYENLGEVAAKSPCDEVVQDSDPSHYHGNPGPTGVILEKHTNGEDADLPPGPILQVGDPVHWTYEVTNGGLTVLNNIEVTDDRGVAVSCPKSTLQPSESMTCTGEGTATAGQYENLGTAVGTPPGGSPVTATDPSHYFGFTPPPPHCGLMIKKYTNGEDADAAPGPTIPVGDPVHWTYVVTNMGQVVLSNVTVTDDRGVAVSCPKTSLAPGEAMTCTGDGIATAGQYANVGTAVGTPPSGPDARDSDPSHYFGKESHGEIRIKKYTNGEDADAAPGPEIPVGDPVHWTYVVTNTGDVALSNVTVTDDRGVAVSCPKTSLASGEAMTCTGNGTATAGQYANTGTAVGTPPSGPNVTDSDPSHYFGKQPPGAKIDIEKYTNGADADAAPGPTIPVGDPVHWTYVVTNKGEVTLSNVTVTDDRGVAVSCPKSTLAPGESMTCTGDGTATAGQYENHGTAAGAPPSGPDVSDSDPSHYFGQTPPSGGEGCTPGYWKNHTDSWPPTGYSPSQSVQSVFAQSSAYPALASASLLDALSFQGGSTLEGAAGNLLRAAVAALLDAAHPNVSYPRTPAGVISDVDAALASGSRDAMLGLASQLDADNNLGCPLN